MSSINPNNIDGTYPIAGQDNDSQGFRDNFTNIKNNFQFAYDELADLQSKAVLKSALSGGALSNDMAYAQLISPQLVKSVEKIRGISGTQTSNFTIDWIDGNYQSFTLGGNLTLTLDSWPTSDVYAKLRLQITTDGGGPYVLTLASGPTYVGVDVIQNTSGNAITLAASGTYLFEFTTADQGTTIVVQDLLRNYEIITTGTTGSFNAVLAGAVSAKTIGNVGTALVGNTLSTTGNVIGGLGQFAAINSTPVGNATASTGAFTTLSASGNLTVASGYVPASNTAPGTAGQIVWNSGNIYVCIATNTWMRAALTSTF